MDHSTTPAATRWLDRPEGRIAYDVQGQGPLVVCLPGMGDLRSTFRHLVPELVAAGHRVATMDLRGHGESDTGFSSYDDVAAGTDALALVAELGGPAVLVGSSMSAGAAVWAAAEEPAAVAGLVLVGPFVRDPPTSKVTRALFGLLMRRPWIRSVWRSYLPSLYAGTRPADQAQHLAAIDRSLRDPGRAAAFAATTRTSHARAEARLARVSAPTLVVMGEKDPDFTHPDAAAEARWVGERLDAQVVLVPEAGHYPHSQRPDVVGPVVTAFLQRVAPRA